MNPSAAAPLGVRDGDMVEVASSTGAIQVRAKLTERIRPDCVLVHHNYGHTVPGLTWSGGASDGYLIPDRAEAPLHGKDWSANAWISDVCVAVKKV